MELHLQITPAIHNHGVGLLCIRVLSYSAMQCSIPAVGLAATVYGMMRHTLFRLPLQLRAFSFPKVFTKTKLILQSTTDHEASRANAAVTYNSRITASTDINDPTTSGFQQNVVVRYGPTPGIADNDGCVHGTATTNAQAYGPAAEAPNSSEGLKAIARRYILDPDTNVDDVHMKPSACGRLKVTITLEVADDA